MQMNLAMSVSVVPLLAQPVVMTTLAVVEIGAHLPTAVLALGMFDQADR